MTIYKASGYESVEESVTFGGTELTKYCHVAGVRRSMPGMDLQTKDVSGIDGRLRVSAKFEPPEVSVYLVLKDMGIAEMREAVHELTSILFYSKVERELKFASDDGWYYARSMVKGRPDLTELVRGGKMRVDFEVFDPFQVKVTTTVNATRTVTLQPEGNYQEIPLIITCDNAKYVSASTPYFRVTVAGGIFDVPLSGTSGTKKVIIDSTKRKVTVNGANALLAMTAMQWPAIDARPSYNKTVTVANGYDGTQQAFKVQYNDRRL